jgi:hypothetical protein
MNERLMKFALRTRTVIYVVGTLALLLSSLTACQKKASAPSGAWASNHEEGPQHPFWPPDLVPHPILPGEGTQEENGGWA